MAEGSEILASMACPSCGSEWVGKERGLLGSILGPKQKEFHVITAQDGDPIQCTSCAENIGIAYSKFREGGNRSRE